MKEPTLLECLFIYKNDEYGQPKYRTNKLNWEGLKYLCKKIIKKNLENNFKRFKIKFSIFNSNNHCFYFIKIKFISRLNI